MAVKLRRECMRATTAADAERDRIRAGEIPNQDDSPDIAAARRRLRRLDVEADALARAAAAYVDCGRGFVYHECPTGHPTLTPRLCGIATICPECARRRSAELAAKYGARVALAMEYAPASARLRLVTAGLRPHGAESPDEALGRCQPAFKSLLRISYGIPQGKREWAVYFELHPVTDKERAGRSAAKARAVRRRAVCADTLRRGWGAVSSLEFGERSMLAHGHALVLGRWVGSRELSRCWRLLTGDSFVVDVRKADVRSVREVVKYSTKLTARTPAQLAAIYRATCGRRRVEAFGCLRGVSTLEQVAEWLRDVLVCEECGEPVKAKGTIPASLAALGIRAPPPEYVFKPRRAS